MWLSSACFNHYCISQTISHSEMSEPSFTADAGVCTVDLVFYSSHTHTRSVIWEMIEPSPGRQLCDGRWALSSDSPCLCSWPNPQTAWEQRPLLDSVPSSCSPDCRAACCVHTVSGKTNWLNTTTQRTGFTIRWIDQQTERDTSTQTLIRGRQVRCVGCGITCRGDWTG